MAVEVLNRPAHPVRPVRALEREMRVVRQIDAELARAKPKLVSADGDEIEVPASVYNVLVRAVRELTRGNGVVIVPVHAELTTQEAADLLNVSRPYLIRLLEDGRIPFTKGRAHRRIRLDDLLKYRDSRSSTRRAALAEMARTMEKHGATD